MPDEDKTFSGSFVLDLRIWWRQAHTLYSFRYLDYTSYVTARYVLCHTSEPPRTIDVFVYDLIVTLL